MTNKDDIWWNIYQLVYPQCRLVERTGGSMGSSLFTVDEDKVEQLTDDLRALINQQQQAYADWVIGGNDTTDKPSDNPSPVNWVNGNIRDDLRAEQRARNNKGGDR